MKINVVGTAVAELNGRREIVDGLEVEELALFEIARVRGDGKATPLDLEDNDIVELTLEDGSSLYLPAGELYADLDRHGRLTRDGDAVELGSTWWHAPTAQTRGLKDIVLKAARFFRVSRIAADLTARAVGEKIESQIQHEGKISRLNFDEEGQLAALEPVAATDIPTNTPILLFLHGTASTTAGSFGGLWSSGDHRAMDELAGHYGPNVFTLEHYTLSKSAFQNAIDVLEGLPQHARVHLISHSRGGQIGELLCRSNRVGAEPFDTLDFDVLDEANDLHAIGLDAAYRAELKRDLRRLADLTTEKAITVERFVRVACPVGGTSILSARVDRWVNRLLSALSFAGLRSSATYSLLKDFVLEAIANRRDAREFPGLEGMTPSSPLAQILNREDVRVTSDLTVVSGDIAGESLKSLALVIATDWIYDDDHDLVVNTISMRGGAKRPEGHAREYFDSDADVNHFSYFKNAKSATVIPRALIEDFDALTGFSPLVVGIAGAIRGISAPRQTGNRPVLFVLPGIMGSHLKMRDERIWIDKSQLIFGGLPKLAVRNNAWIESDGVHEDSYADLIGFMAESHDVRIFDYDWRLPIAESARRLAVQVEEAIADSSHPVRFLAHSMGGLVVRTLFALRSDLYERLAARAGFRFVMLGTPTGGSHAIVRVLLGYKGVLKLLAFADVTSSKKQLLEVISDFDGLLQLLPVRDAHGNDFFEAAVWDRLESIERLNWERPDADRIDAVADFRSVLDSFELDPENSIYVAGKAKETVASMLFQENRPFRPLKFLGTDRGDGSVPWDTGIPEGIPVWYVDAEHGAMPRCQDAFEGYLDLLSEGSTQSSALSTSHGLTTRGDAPLFEIQDDELGRAPSIHDIDRVIFDGRPSDRARAAPERGATLEVGVVHGDLKTTEAIVMVGHYRNDAIIHAEKIIDQCLDGRLSRMHAIGGYPSKVGDAEVFFAGRGRTLNGAVVLGLGEFGLLTAGNMVEAFREGVLAFSRARDNLGTYTADAPVALATLLIGSGATGIGTEASIAALVKGIQQANAHLERVDAQDSIVTKVEIIELWEDRAIAAGHALRGLVQSRSVSGVKVIPYATRKGWRRRIRFDDDVSWWRRIEIEVDEERRDSLRFRAITDRARIDERLVLGRLGAIDEYVRSASDYRSASRPQIGITLFEYLVPYSYKPFGVNEEQLVLVVDDFTASIPWELMIDRVASEAKGQLEPIAVAAGMVRQLAPASFEEEFRPVAPTRKALVISNPADTGLADLPGARQEAEKVVSVLGRAGLEMLNLPNARAKAIKEALVAGDFRILHIAGHGMRKTYTDEDGREVVKSGLVMEAETLLTGDDLGAIRYVPEIAFINCCHLGNFQNNPDVDHFRYVAASLARKLIAMGAKAVVAAGWAVNDAGAERFAEVFYDSMLSGAEFGDAVHRARRAAFAARSDNTWGAYQCYGNPSFRLSRGTRGTSTRRAGAGTSEFLTPQEALVELQSVAADAGEAQEDQIAAVRRSADQLAARIPPPWLAKDGRLPATFGKIYGQLGDFCTAISFYERALASEEQTPINVIEQRWNLLSRSASGSPAERLQTQGDVIDGLEQLNRITAPSSERLAMLGSAYKRRSMVSAGAERAQDLKAAADAYEEAAKLARSNEGKDEYAANQSYLASILYSRTRNLRTQGKRAVIDDLNRRLNDRASPEKFWDVAGTADLKLTLALWSVDIEALESVRHDYRAAFQKRPSAREWQSVEDTWNYVRYHLEQHTGDKRSRDAGRLLRAMPLGILED